ITLCALHQYFNIIGYFFMNVGLVPLRCKRLHTFQGRVLRLYDLGSEGTLAVRLKLAANQSHHFVGIPKTVRSGMDWDETLTRRNKAEQGFRLLLGNGVDICI